METKKLNFSTKNAITNFLIISNIFRKDTTFFSNHQIPNPSSYDSPSTATPAAFGCLYQSKNNKEK